MAAMNDAPPPGAASREPRHGFGWRKKMRETDEFSSVFRFRCAYRGAGLELLAAPNGLGFPRLGMIIPKKVLRTAVARNRVKRLLREWFRLRQEEFGGQDFIARLRATAAEDQLAADFAAGVSRCKSCVSARASSLT